MVKRYASDEDRILSRAGMMFRIHFTANGVDDSVVVEGDTVEEIRVRAEAEVARRNGVDPWSEELP